MLSVNTLSRTLSRASSGFRRFGRQIWTKCDDPPQADETRCETRWETRGTYVLAMSSDPFWTPSSSTLYRKHNTLVLKTLSRTLSRTLFHIQVKRGRNWRILVLDTAPQSGAEAVPRGGSDQRERQGSGQGSGQGLTSTKQIPRPFWTRSSSPTRPRPDRPARRLAFFAGGSALFRLATYSNPARALPRFRSDAWAREFGRHIE